METRAVKRLTCLWLCLLLTLTACSGAAGVKPPATLVPEPTLAAIPQPADCHGSTPTGPPIALVGGTLIDGTGADPLPNGALVIQGCRIAAVGPRAEVAIPADAQVIELDEATVLPGLINAHVHAAYSARNLRAWAQAGVTTVRDLGAPVGNPYFETRDRLAADPANARVVSAGPIVTVPGGYPIVPNDFPSLAVTSPEDARQQIARLIDEGADVIKIAFSSSPPTLSPEEAAVIVQTAHERGIPVTAHATNPRELQRALDAGVDDVAHISGDEVSSRTIRRMVEAGVYWVPTLEALHGEGGDNLLRFVEAGGQVALGTDAGYLPGLEIGTPLDELALMAEAGMTPMQIIVAATRSAAHVCRLERHLGTLEVGKLADVLVVAGDPLRDLGALADVRLVIHGGVIISQESGQ
jgi:imidazolonepropionase-like amidohydrolase